MKGTMGLLSRRTSAKKKSHAAALAAWRGFTKGATHAILAD